MKAAKFRSVISHSPKIRKWFSFHGD